MKNKKMIITVCVILMAAVTAAIVVTSVIIGKRRDKPTISDTGVDAATTDDLNIGEPSEDETSVTGGESGDETQKSDGNDAAGNVTDEDTDGTDSEPATQETDRPETTWGDEAEKADEPIVEKKPEDDSGTESGGGITIGEGQTEKYDCGSAGHNCDGPETHAYITNLEIEGCKYCGRHDCPSFYATDEWGHTCYTPSKCPNYDIHKDPVYYCQTCGLECGSGPDKCTQFVTPCNCPNCGEYVEAWTCHSCG